MAPRSLRHSTPQLSIAASSFRWATPSGDEPKAAKVADPDFARSAANERISLQVDSSNGRLIVFCRVTPLRKAVLAEVRRCIVRPLIVGLKLHFGNSGLRLRDWIVALRLCTARTISRIGTTRLFSGRDMRSEATHRRRRAAPFLAPSFHSRPPRCD